MNDVTTAEIVLKDINDFIKENMQTNDSDRQMTINNYIISLNMKKDIYDGAEQLYTNQFENINSM